ncbi:MAG: SH3 domain-containing protein [Clostridia bacterium]|nr:SH3 domain-containing protein [Clostridia bacterium]
MFQIISKNKAKGICFFTILFLFAFITNAKSLGMHYYEKLDFSTGIVTASVLNVRSGPGTSYKIITQAYKNEYIRIFAKIGNWYVVQTDKDFVGAVNKEYVKAIYPQKQETKSANEDEKTINTDQDLKNESTLTKDEENTLNLINEQRTVAGLNALIIDEEVQNIARIKAQDMVNGGYFSHTSPTYGSPFDMLKNYGISYKTAGENIAGNSSNSGAVNAWMNSEGHRANILNNGYSHTGLAVVSSPKYGKIFVQIFIGK